MSGNTDKITQYLTDKSHLILFKREELIGAKTIADYFSKWISTAKDENLQVKVSVEWNLNQCRPLFMYPQKDTIR